MNYLKRMMPLLITATVGFVLIVASFIPATVGWGEVAAVWFDILAAVAFILGGGNLLKVQLKKISDQAAGWGYAVVTLVAFLVTLFVGLLKVGAARAEPGILRPGFCRVPPQRPSRITKLPCPR